MDKIDNILISMGFKCNNMGYKYLNELIKLGISGRKILPLNGFGYTYLASKYNKSINSITKCIENSISRAFSFGNNYILYEYFKESIDKNQGKPSNKQFILTIIDKILY